MSEKRIALLTSVKYIKNSEETECSICIEDFIVNEDLKMTSCGHKYHKKCITDWLSRKAVCP